MKLTHEFSEYQPWQGAISTWNKIADEGKLSDLESLLEDCYGEVMDEMTLNDILWFDRDMILESLGIDDK